MSILLGGQQRLLFSHLLPPPTTPLPPSLTLSPRSFPEMVNWFPLESNPEVLTTYSCSLGLKPSYQFADLIALEPWAFDMLPGKVRL